MKNYRTRAMVYTTEVNGNIRERLHKFIVRETEEEFNEVLEREIKETKLNLRYNDDVELR